MRPWGDFPMNHWNAYLYNVKKALDFLRSSIIHYSFCLIGKANEL